MPKFLEKAADKENPTIGEVYGPAMEITDQEEANTYFENILKLIMKRNGWEWTAANRAEAEKLVKSNLGYYAGYYDDKTRERVERLYRCTHPIFGSIAENGAPTAEEAFNAGIRVAAEWDEDGEAP